MHDLCLPLAVRLAAIFSLFTAGNITLSLSQVPGDNLPHPSTCSSPRATTSPKPPGLQTRRELFLFSHQTLLRPVTDRLIRRLLNLTDANTQQKFSLRCETDTSLNTDKRLNLGRCDSGEVEDIKILDLAR